MASHEYSPRHALELLLRKVRERDPDLAIGLEAVIDAGTDVVETETLRTAERPREFRKTVRFSDEEALDIALLALRAHFVEQPLLATSAMSEFGKAALEPEGSRRAGASFDQSTSPSGEEEPLSIGVEFELQTETQVLPKDEQAVEETAPLSPPQNESLDEQQANIDRLTALLRFEER